MLFLPSALHTAGLVVFALAPLAVAAYLYRAAGRQVDRA
jgi:cbb3-type cytochrome oxidase subunit 3